MKEHKKKQVMQRQLLRRRMTPRAIKRRRVFRALSALMITAMLCAGGWLGYPYLWDYLCSLNYFRVTEIAYAGLDRIAQSELQDLLPPVMGVNLFALDMETLQSKLECHPWVESAELRRNLPHTLAISIQERKPAALVMRNGSWAVDRHGVILPITGGRGDLDLPIINIGVGTEPMAGIALAEKRVLELLPLLEALRQRLPELWQMISEISWDERGQLYMLAFDQTAKVLLGDKVSWRQMLNLYAFLNHQGHRPGMQDIIQVDLRFWGQVVVRRASAQSDSTTKVAA